MWEASGRGLTMTNSKLAGFGPEIEFMNILGHFWSCTGWAKFKIN